MPINEEKNANSLVIDTTRISLADIQNRFGAKHDVIKDVPPGKYITILAVETNGPVQNVVYQELENVRKDHFGVNAMQTVFAADIPSEENFDDHSFNIYITAHLRIENRIHPVL